MSLDKDSPALCKNRYELENMKFTNNMLFKNKILEVSKRKNNAKGIDIDEHLIVSTDPPYLAF